jgi:hypothetical protein
MEGLRLLLGIPHFLTEAQQPGESTFAWEPTSIEWITPLLHPNVLFRLTGSVITRWPGYG